MKSFLSPQTRNATLLFAALLTATACSTPATAPAGPGNTLQAHVWQCSNGSTINTRNLTSPPGIALRTGSKTGSETRTLPQVRAASGVRYQDAVMQFWTKGDSATLERQPGEQFGGSLSPAAREAALIASYLADHRSQVERRWNWMAAQAMLNGTITLSGDDYPTTTIDFGRAAGQTITLGSGSRWGDSGIVALDNIETWSTTVFNAVGYPVDVVIMGTTAWTAFRLMPPMSICWCVPCRWVSCTMQ